jgi:UPF0755 protein
MKNLLKIIAGLFAVFLLIGVVGLLFASHQLKPANPSKIEKQTFVVPHGQSIVAIGNRLEEAGLIKNHLAFRYIVWQENLKNKIQAGTFMLSPSMSVSEIANELTTGTNDTWITVLEGWRREEIAEMIDARNLENFDKKEFLDLSAHDEGYLFPDKYLIPITADAKSVHDLLTNTFDKKVTTALDPDIQASGKKLDEVIVLASLVQREARDPESMKMVAGILENRLKLGMPLQVDATLQYIAGYNKEEKSWWITPLDMHKDIDSPFNTYKNAGLPPKPIDNPGLDAIQAVLHPTKSDYLFYISDKSGNMHYSKTLQEHNAFVQQYLR